MNNLKITLWLLGLSLFGCDVTKDVPKSLSENAANQNEVVKKDSDKEVNQLDLAVNMIEKGMPNDNDEGKEFKMVHDVPYGVSDLGYQVAVQRGWAYTSLQSKQEVNTAKLTLIGRYFGKRENSKLPPELRIRAIQLEGQKTKSLDWLKGHFGKFGVQIQKVNYESPFISDITIKFEVDGEAFLGRVMGRVAADKLFLVECVSPENVIETYNENCLYAMRSFKLDIEPSTSKKINLVKKQ